MAEKTQLTKEGYKKLEEELRHLIDVDREEVKAQISQWLFESADYTAAATLDYKIEIDTRL